MKATEKQYWASVDKMLDRWEKETQAGKDNPGRVSDPKPEWNHNAYLRKIYSNQRNYK